MAEFRLRDAVEDVAIGAASGYVATRVMEAVSMKLYEWEPETDRKREDAVRPGEPFEVAAAKTAEVLGISMTERQRNVASMAFHIGLGMGWSPLYALIRRRWRTRPVPTALGSVAAMTILVDEGLTPLLGFSASNRDYPAITHLRGLVAHLVFGAAAAMVTEAAWCLRGRRP